MILYFIFDFFNLIVYLCLNGFTYQNICWNIIDTYYMVEGQHGFYHVFLLQK